LIAPLNTRPLAMDPNGVFEAEMPVIERSAFEYVSLVPVPFV
jgi:hypothetical protein